jgi:hypothetical protein
LKQNKCNLELAQYWFNNRDDVPEFKDIPEFLAEYKLQEWLKILSDLTDKKIITFIAPDNIYSDATIVAARNKYFKIITWNWNGFFDYNEYLNEKKDSVDLVVADSIKNANIKWFSIIMIHAKDYVDQFWEIDPNKYSEYLNLLNELKNKWFSFTTMSEYYSYLSKQNMETDFFDKSILMPKYKDK